MEQYSDIHALRWDWKESVDWRKLVTIIQEFSKNGIIANVYDIDTGSDDYGILISPREIDESEHKKIWHMLAYGGD